VCHHGRAFQSLDYRFNEKNLGPYASCKIALDHAFDKHEFVVLIEDDIVLSADALLWFNGIRNLGLLEHGNNWAIAGQSIFFDARKKAVDQGFVQRVARLAEEQDLAHKFTTHDFVPSSCFATTRRWWAEFGNTRGEPRGDVSLCRRTKEEGRGCVFPIVPRAKDVGMLHDYGYSVTIHTREGVEAITRPYLLAEDLPLGRPIDHLNLESFQGDQGLLFRQTTLLEEMPLTRTARVDVATAASQAKDWQRAAALWDELRSEFPQDAFYWLKTGEALSEARMLEPAERIFGEALSLFPDHKWIGYHRIRAAQFAEDWREALKRAETLRAAAPDFWPAWVATADTLAMLGDADEAEEQASQAVARFPREFWPHYGLAKLQAARSDPHGAVRVWKKLVERFPAEKSAADALKAAAREAERKSPRA
jgi:tetratricopeptide (TPR) repeat protein